VLCDVGFARVRFVGRAAWLVYVVWIWWVLVGGGLRVGGWGDSKF